LHERCPAREYAERIIRALKERGNRIELNCIIQRAKIFQRETAMRPIMFAMSAAFILSGAMAVFTTAQAEDNTTIIRHDDGNKTVIKKKEDDGEKKVIIHKND
jgi:hypothetical protein